MADLRQRLDVDDVDQSEQEGKPVLNPGHVGEQAALGQNLHHWEKARFLEKHTDLGPHGVLGRDVVSRLRSAP